MISLNGKKLLYTLNLFVSLLICACAYRMGNIYQVQNEETLSGLAHRFDVSIEELLAANPHLKQNELMTGQKLMIPGAKYRPDPIVKMTEVELALPIPSKEPPLLNSSTKPTKVVKPIPTQNSTASSKQDLIWPLKGKVISGYGKRNEKMHNGIDIQSKPLEKVSAVAGGKIVFQGDSIEGYGNMIIVKHENNLYSVYAFLGEAMFQTHELVTQGQAIARVSKEKNQSFIHFELRIGKSAINPSKMLPKL